MEDNCCTNIFQLLQGTTRKFLSCFVQLDTAERTKSRVPELEFEGPNPRQSTLDNPDIMIPRMIKKNYCII